MPCPICRRMFKIPPEGFRGLPKNFFIERLIHVSKVSEPCTEVKVLCSLCLEDSMGQEGTEIPTANIYCVDCKYKLCDECCSEHRRFKATKNHKLIPINEYESGQHLKTDLAQSVCEIHEQNSLNVYCADCKTVVCAICFIEEHRNHKGSHINKCLDGFRKQIENNTETMNECIAQAQIKKAELVKVKQEMQQMVESLECDVEKRKNEIKAFADKHASYLLEGLCLERQSRLKEIQMATDDTDAYLTNLESYNSYCQRIMDKGSASDICSAHSDLSVRAFELQQQCQPIIERGVQNFKFCFRQSEIEEFLEEDHCNLVGKIEEEGGSKPKKKSKPNLLVEQGNKIDLLKKKIEIERTEKESFMLTTEQLRITVAKEVQVNKTLTEKLSNAEANYDAQIAGLKQELDKNKVAKDALQTNNDKLKQELDAEKQNNLSLQTRNDKFDEDLDMYKVTVKTFETKAKKLKKELDRPTTKTDELRYKSIPVLVQTIRTKASEEKKTDIYGLTILDKELFVVNDRNSEVEVYDSIKFSVNRRWQLRELKDPWDVGSCNRNKCIYILDYKGMDKSKEILRVDPNGQLLKKWSTGVDYGSLSVTDESNIIVTFCNKHRLNEFTPDGQLIREINLSSHAGIQYPWHAIKLTNGHFVVSHGSFSEGLHRVCVVDSDGKLKKSFGGKHGSTVGQMNNPMYLAVDGNGLVMVADCFNNRVLLLNSDLKFKREILSNEEKHGLRRPSRILLDERNGRLWLTTKRTINGS